MRMSNVNVDQVCQVESQERYAWQARSVHILAKLLAIVGLREELSNLVELLSFSSRYTLKNMTQKAMTIKNELARLS